MYKKQFLRMQSYPGDLALQNIRGQGSNFSPVLCSTENSVFVQSYSLYKRLVSFTTLGTIAYFQGSVRNQIAAAPEQEPVFCNSDLYLTSFIK